MTYAPAATDIDLLDGDLVDLVPAQAQKLRAVENHQRATAYGWGSPAIALDAAGLLDTGSSRTMSARIPPGVTAVRVGCIVRGFGTVTVATDYGSVVVRSHTSMDAEQWSEALAVDSDEGYRWTWRTITATVTVDSTGGGLTAMLLSSLILAPETPVRTTERSWVAESWALDGTGQVAADGAAGIYDYEAGWYVSLWARRTATGSAAVLWSLSASGDDATVRLQLDSAGTQIGIVMLDTDGTTNLGTSGFSHTWTAGEWRHILALIVPSDITACALWVDGVLVSSAGTSGTEADISASLDECTIGAVGTASRWEGWISDVALYGPEVTPSASEIYGTGVMSDQRLLTSWPGLREYLVPGSGDESMALFGSAAATRTGVAVDSEIPT